MYEIKNDPPVKKIKKQWKLIKLSGRYGIALIVREKELFIGLQLSDIVVEQVFRKMLKLPKQGNITVVPLD